jgi:hypothetical protein
MEPFLSENEAKDEFLSALTLLKSNKKEKEQVKTSHSKD